MKKLNMKTFNATLTFVQYSCGEVLIKARSLKEARCKADEIGGDEVDDWNAVDGEVSVESVTEQKPRKKTSQTRPPLQYRRRIADFETRMDGLAGRNWRDEYPRYEQLNFAEKMETLKAAIAEYED